MIPFEERCYSCACFACLCSAFKAVSALWNLHNEDCFRKTLQNATRFVVVMWTHEYVGNTHHNESKGKIIWTKAALVKAGVHLETVRFERMVISTHFCTPLNSKKCVPSPVCLCLQTLMQGISECSVSARGPRMTLQSNLKVGEICVWSGTTRSEKTRVYFWRCTLLPALVGSARWRENKLHSRCE